MKTPTTVKLNTDVVQNLHAVLSEVAHSEEFSLENVKAALLTIEKSVGYEVFIQIPQDVFDQLHEYLQTAFKLSRSGETEYYSLYGEVEKLVFLFRVNPKDRTIFFSAPDETTKSGLTRSYLPGNVDFDTACRAIIYHAESSITKEPVAKELPTVADPVVAASVPAVDLVTA